MKGLLNIILFLLISLVAIGQDIALDLSSEQSFIVPDDAPNSEYVGIIKVYPQHDSVGSTPSFSLLDDYSGRYAISTTGLLTISSNTSLLGDTDNDTISVMITKSGYENDTIEVYINILDADNCVFIDYDAGVDGTGTRASPRNTKPTTVDNYNYLYKRGSTIDAYQNYNGLDNSIVASYGAGNLPVIRVTGQNVFGLSVGIIGSDTSEYVTVRDLEFTSVNDTIFEGTGEGNTTNFRNTWGGGAITAGHNPIYTIFTHNVVHHLWQGSYLGSYNGFGSTNIGPVTIEWNTFYQIMWDIVFTPWINSGDLNINYNNFFQINRGSVYLDIYDGSTNPQVYGQGDAIQTGEFSGDEEIIRWNYIDKSDANQKFNVIVGQCTGNRYLEHNYILCAEYEATGIYYYDPIEGGEHYIRYNTFIHNSAYTNVSGLWFDTGLITDTIVVAYNVFKGFRSVNAILGGNNGTIAIYNNVFYDNTQAIANNMDARLRNNIFYLNTGQEAYSGTTDDSDYNLFNTELSGMFGAGNDNLSSVTGESNSKVGDPLFLDANNNDFRVSEISPAVDSAISVNLTADYYSSPLTGTPDIGVYEYITEITTATETTSMVTHGNTVLIQGSTMLLFKR